MTSADLFIQIQSQSRRKALNIQDLFEDYDFKREGKVSIYQFRRVFLDLEVALPEPAVADLLTKYQIGSNQFNYRQFVKDLEDPPTASAVTQDQLREFGRLITLRNATLRECLCDADRYHLGRVTRDGFLGAVGRTALTESIARQYTRPPHDDVYYIDLARDVDAAMRTTPLRRERSPPAFFPEVARAIITKSIDVYRILSGYDRHKKLTIPLAHFLSEVSGFRLGLTAEQLQELGDAFVQDGEFDYVAFSAAVDLFRVPETKTSPTPISINISVILKRIEEILAERRITIELLFARVQPSEGGRVSVITFRKIITDAGFRLDPREFQALVDEFRVGDNEVNYRAFAVAVTPQPKPMTSEADQLLGRLKDFLGSENRPLRPLLAKVADGNGAVTWQQLISILRSILFDLDQREARLLRLTTTDVVDI